MRCELLWTHLLLLLLLLVVDSTDLTEFGLRGCRRSCGSTLIRYPFGIGKGCYFNKWFEIQCKNSTSREQIPYLPMINKEVVSINLFFPTLYQTQNQQNPYGSILIKTNITSIGCSNSSDASTPDKPFLDVKGSPFTIDSTNKLVGVGCNITAKLTYLEPKLVGCIASCEETKNKHNNSECYGYRCCQTETLDYLEQVVGVIIEDRSNKSRGMECRVAFLTDGSTFQSLQYRFNVSKFTDPEWFYNMQYATVQLGWVIPMENSSYVNQTF